jgi:hypothetical protein
VWRGTVPTKGLAESSTDVGAVSARRGQVKVFQTAARMCLRCARRRANWITLQRWRCSNTASSPLCVRVGAITFCFPCPKDGQFSHGFRSFRAGGSQAATRRIDGSRRGLFEQTRTRGQVSLGVLGNGIQIPFARNASVASMVMSGTF